MSETKTKNLCTVPAADLTDSQYFIAEDGGELKRIPKAQVVLKKLEDMLATDTENLAGGGEVTAQELLDALAEQVANKLLAKSQVVNNLLATVEGNPLDATQGKALKELIDTTNNNLSNRFSSDSLVYNSIDDIPKSGSCFGTISKSIKIGTITIPAYSRFSFINTGTSTDGALFAIDSNGYSYTAYRTSGVWNKCFATATKDDLNTVLMYRGVITGDLNRGRNLVIAPGIYSIQSVSTITNGPSDFGGWGIFVQFPDNLFSQMILNSPNYIKFRKYSGQNPSWGAW